VACVEEKRRRQAGQIQENKPLARPGLRLEDNIEMYLSEIMYTLPALVSKLIN
jgi:hypothetical protein